MSTDTIAQHDQRIAAAYAALRGARAAAERSPNRDSLAVLAMCERTLDDLLDCRPRSSRED